MAIVTRFSISVDGYVTTPGGWPVLTADPTFVSGRSHGFPEFQKRCEAVVMGRTTFEPALTSPRWPWPDLDVFVLGSNVATEGAQAPIGPTAIRSGWSRRCGPQTGAGTFTSWAARGRSRRSGRSAPSTSSACS
jgi:hypothetical protein